MHRGGQSQARSELAKNDHQANAIHETSKHRIGHIADSAAKAREAEEYLQ